MFQSQKDEQNANMRPFIFQAWFEIKVRYFLNPRFFSDMETHVFA